MKPLHIHGLVAATFTPFHPDGSVNPALIRPYAQRLRGQGVRGVFVCGTTGESLSLTTAERRSIAEEWLRVADDEFPVLVHVGDNCLANARELAVHAVKIRAGAISAIAPTFFRPRDTADLVEWCAAIASAAPDLPFYYYHLPSFTGVHFPVVEFLEQAARIRNLAGVKFTHEDLEDFAACVRFAQGRYEIMFGRDELLLESLSRGGYGAIGSTYNYAAPLYTSMISAQEAGNDSTARLLQDEAVRMIALCSQTGVTHLAAAKALMALQGLDCGPVRLPLRQPTQSQVSTLRAALSALPLFRENRDSRNSRCVSSRRTIS
jgi:N-acetylneuraminate lyase